MPAEGDSKQKTAAMMQQVARLLEAGIRAHPQDWHMLQRVFAGAGGRFAIRIRQFELFLGTRLSTAIRAGNAGRISSG